jgi:23S rRNA (uridine2552-2'-O)-methyltransferase
MPYLKGEVELSQYKRPDKYAKKAKADGFEARSVYKLQEINKRARVFRQGQRVVDLGCFPGSWTRYAVAQVGKGGRVVGVDLNESLVPNAKFVVRSVYEVEPDEVLEMLDGRADIVLSDMAQKTSGNRDSDHSLQIDLARRALFLAVNLLTPGGSFVCKVFEGAEATDFVNEARVHFGKVKRMRPDAVRKVSREWFLVATNFKG